MEDHQPQHFDSSARPTLGVEWEVALLDPETRDLVPRGAEVIAAATERDPGIHLEPEFLRNTVEMVTPVCRTVPEAVRNLDRCLAAISAAAGERDLRVWSSGSHPFSDFRSNPVSGKSSYEEIIERTRYWGNQMLIWGIHVHVGVSHRDRVWPLINALMTFYPHLLCPSASSPGWDGLDTGYASNRTMLYQQLPTAGMPPHLTSWREWEDYMRDQDRSGVINHTGSMHLDIRPAGKWGTIEVRISDATSNLRDLAGLVALTHCLVVHHDALLDAEGPAALPSLPQWHLAENKWRAARYGLDALIITSRATEEHWVRDELADLVERLRPTARGLGCERELGYVLDTLERGGSYERQRALHEESGSWFPAIDATCEELQTIRPDAETTAS